MDDIQQPTDDELMPDNTIEADDTLFEGITKMKAAGLSFEMAVQITIDIDNLAKMLAIHSRTGHIYDLKEQPLYLLATVVLAWFKPELMEDNNG